MGARFGVDDRELATPEQVKDHTKLSREQKIDLLRRWAYDAVEIEVAVEEGMPDLDRRDLLRRILIALEELGEPLDLERTGPSKQHPLPPHHEPE
jgi:hypothetical protein